MEDGTWVRVVTYDWIFGIPTWAERDASVIGDPTGYHELCVPPRTILHLAPEVAENLLLKPRAVHLPGKREDYTPVLEREKVHEITEDTTRPRRRVRPSDMDDSVRVIRLVG